VYLKTETASASETVGDFLPDYTVLHPRRQKSLRYLNMKAVGDSEPLVNTYQIHGVISRRTAIFNTILFLISVTI
jgi:hypothetical protein